MSLQKWGAWDKTGEGGLCPQLPSIKPLLLFSVCVGFPSLRPPVFNQPEPVHGQHAERPVGPRHSNVRSQQPPRSVRADVSDGHPRGHGGAVD